jgi:hypothetical protein
MAMTAASMAEKVKAAVDAVAPVQSSDANVLATYRLEIYTAMCQGIIEEIVANSELVPTSQDSGSAGAGIITGTVR